MQLKVNALTQSEWFTKRRVALPGYDVAEMQEQGRTAPRWVHLGPGNLCRAFIARMACDLLAADMWWPITGVVTRDRQSTKVQLTDHDLLTLRVGLPADGDMQLRVVAGMSELIATTDPDGQRRLATIIADPEVAVVSATITEKGYDIAALTDGDDHAALLSEVCAAFDDGTVGRFGNAMAVLTAGLHERFLAGGAPITVISMDNFTHNGDKFADSVRTLAALWARHGAAEQQFVDWVSDDSCVAFPLSVIDKITPRPSPAVAAALIEELDFEDMELRQVDGQTIAGFVNTEIPEYLLVEDRFAGPRPPLDTVGALFVDRETCLDFERMKVTTCLNPVHTALALAACLLGIPTIDAAIADPDLRRLVTLLAYHDGLPVVATPDVISPQDFLTELFDSRLSNAAMPDDPSRIAMDTSQKVAIRFGETLKEYQRRGMDLEQLQVIPLIIALWLRYLVGVDDKGCTAQLASDPRLPELTGIVADIRLGAEFPEQTASQLRQLLGDSELFGIDLTAAGLAPVILDYLHQLCAAPGAVRRTIAKVTNQP